MLYQCNEKAFLEGKFFQCPDMMFLLFCSVIRFCGKQVCLRICSVSFHVSDRIT